MKNECFDVVIVGAGLSGLVAGSLLLKDGASVVLLEKSKGVGGRLASRRITTRDGGEAHFDHGAQFLEISHSKCQSILESALGKDLPKSWKIQNSWGLDLYRPLPSMNAFPKLFSAAKHVVREKKVTQIFYDDSLEVWSLLLNTGEMVSGKAILSTAPLPQLIEILNQNNLIERVEDIPGLRSINYAPSISVMLVLEEPGGSIFLKDPDPAIHWLIDNQWKGISTHSPSATLLAAASWSEAHFQETDSQIYDRLMKIVGVITNLKPISYQIHRWRYAIPRVGIEKPFFHLKIENASENSPFLLAGDPFGKPQWSPIERAIFSGSEAAQFILDRWREANNK